jgi:hypothetical protein
LRYDLRKLKGHALVECDGTRYAYRLTPKGVQVALLFLLLSVILVFDASLVSLFEGLPGSASRVL